MSEQASILIIAGPTASGKSALAMAVAEEFDGCVINADSMQIYADLRVLSARPSEDDEARVPHRLYGVLDGSEVCSAALWRELAVQAIRETLAEGRLPIICGGTGLYIKALTDGLNEMPAIPDDVRERVRADLEDKGSPFLHDELKAGDPETADRLEPGDSQRVARAVEVLRATGKSISWWQTQAPVIEPPKGWRFTTIALIPPREELYDRCNKRFSIMLEEGAIEEVQALAARGLDHSLPVMRALGVPELIAYLAGEIDLEEAERQASQGTRRYAKRQNTWLSNQIITKNVFNSKYSKSLLPSIFAIIRQTVLTTPK